MAIDFEKLGEKFRGAREERGLSQSHVADMAGIDRTYLGKIERGEVNLSLGIFVTISRALGLRASDLLEACDE